MDVQVAETGPCRRTLTIKVPPEHIRGHLKRAFDAAGQQVKMKGFRAGRVPRKVIEKKFGDEIRAETKERILNEVFNDVLREHGLRVVGRPEVEGLDASPVDDTATLEFTVHVDVHPEFELSDIRGIEVEARSTDVTDEDIDNALKQLADQKKTIDAVDEPIEENDFVRAELVFENSEGTEVHRREGAQLNANIPIAGTDPEAFKAALIGQEKGSSFSMPITFPESFDVEDVRGQSGTIQVELTEVRRIQPAPIDDELAKGFEMDSLDALKAELRNRIGEEKSQAETVRQESAILDALAIEHHFPLPQTMVEEQLGHSLAQFRKQLAEREQLSEEQIDERIEQARPEARQDAEHRVRMFFLLESIAQTEQITVSSEELDTEFANIATQHGATAAEVRKYYEEKKLVGDLQLGILERKVRDFLRANAKITDTKGGSA